MAKRKQKQTTVQQQLIQFILDSELNQNELSRRTGIPHSNLSSFVHGKRGLSLEAVNRMCEALGLQLVKQGEK